MWVFNMQLFEFILYYIVLTMIWEFRRVESYPLTRVYVIYKVLETRIDKILYTGRKVVLLRQSNTENTIDEQKCFLR